MTSPRVARVVHVRSGEHDVYIGRPGVWGNPFVIGKDGTRDDVVEKYRRWVVGQPTLMARIGELRGKTLGCFCAPKRCHGDVLAHLANTLDIDQTSNSSSTINEYKRDASSAFDASEIERVRTPDYKSREKLVSMAIDDFLALAKPGRDCSKLDGLAELRRAGQAFREIPFLNFWTQGDDPAVRRVDGHEGRHRAMVLRDEGFTHIPVILRGDIRWSEQSDPKRWDYVAQWPVTLISEDGSCSRPFPVRREEAFAPWSAAIPAASAVPVYATPSSARPSFDADIHPDTHEPTRRASRTAP
jgi:hypothetical protein